MSISILYRYRLLHIFSFSVIKMKVRCSAISPCLPTGEFLDHGYYPYKKFVF